MRIYNFYLLAFIILASGCKNESMKFELARKQELKGIPSASGIELTDAGIFVIGDNSPWLYLLTEDLEIKDKFQLLPERKAPDSIFEKVIKPDFEAICKVDGTGQRLFIFGSGSKSPERDVLVEVDLSKGFSSREYSLEKFYDKLKSSANLTAAQLNIEGAEIVGDQLYLLNRGRNLILKYSLSEFTDHLKNEDSVPEPEVFDFELPKIKGIEAGFSGVSYVPGAEALLFTATVEDTSNWIDDGEVLGSFLGLIYINEMGKVTNPRAVAIERDGEAIKIKVESATILSPYKTGEAKLLLVTDSDGDISEILTGSLTY